MTTETLVVVDFNKPVIQVMLQNGELWEILTDKLTAVKVPKKAGLSASLLSEADDIRTFLQSKGFKQIVQLSENVVTFEERMPTCKRCKTNKNVVKAGRQTLSKSRHRRYLCKECNYRFTTED